jgi:hypothetical protein
MSSAISRTLMESSSSEALPALLMVQNGNAVKSFFEVPRFLISLSLELTALRSRSFQRCALFAGIFLTPTQAFWGRAGGIRAFFGYPFCDELVKRIDVRPDNFPGLDIITPFN